MLTHAEVHARVVAWLSTRRSWVAESKEREALSFQWLHCERVFGATSAPSKGVLLDLVRAAWNDPRMWVEHSAFSPSVAVTKCERGGPQVAVGAGEIDALVAALEAAP